MGYLITQIIFFLLVAAVIGFIFGWLLRRFVAAKHERALIVDWESRVRVAEHTRDKYEQQTHDLKTRLSSLESKYEQAESRFAGVKEELKDRDASVALLEHEMDEWKGKVQSVETSLREREYDLDEWKGKVPPLESTLQAEIDRVSELRSQMKDRDRRMSELEHQIKVWQDKHEASTRQAADLTAQLAGQRKEVGIWKTRHANLESENKERQQTLAILVTEREEWKKKHAILERQLSRRQEVVPAAPPEPARRTDRAVSKDNLQEIHGIGPVLEGTLNDLGIYRFQQIAELSGEEISQIAEKLKTFPDRIRRDKWVDQARALQRAHLASDG